MEEIARYIIRKETERQHDHLEMIASENFVSPQVMEAAGSVLTNKYAEGYPGKRYYSGCEHVDEAERLAIDRAQKLFGAEHVNVQPHSGSGANMSVYFSMLKPGDKILSMSLDHGGHLSHGSPVNFTGKFYEIIPYGVSKETGRIDYEEVEKLAKEHQPKMIVCGASAYSREIDFEAFRKIADTVGAYLLADIAHIAGLVATNIHPSPIQTCDFVTTTTHKTLRGPRGGIVMCKEKYAKKIGSSIFPGTQGGPLMHIILAKAIAFGEALKPEFEGYCQQIIKNAKTLGEELVSKGLDITTGGTDNHLILLDLRKKGDLTGKVAEEALEKAGIAVNKNMVPFDERKPFITSGLRIGTPALTTRGMKEKEMVQVGDWISKVIDHVDDINVIGEVRNEISAFCKNYPLFTW